jgi:hypothetical protein
MGKLKGSSMVEAIVASLIFITVFAISLTTLTRLTLRKDEGYVLLEAERAMAECSMRYGNGTWSEGEYNDDFEWGEITTVIAPYSDYKRIQQVSLRVTIRGSRKTIEHRGLTVRKDE